MCHENMLPRRVGTASPELLTLAQALPLPCRNNGRVIAWVQLPGAADCQGTHLAALITHTWEKNTLKAAAAIFLFAFVF